MYWTLKSIPELAHLPKTEAQRVWGRHCWKVFFSRRVLGAFLIAPIFFTLPWLVGTLFPDMPLPAYLSGAVICFVLGFASALYMPQVLIRAARPFLQEEGRRCCLRCGYVLEALPPRTSCPECGTASRSDGERQGA